MTNTPNAIQRYSRDFYKLLKSQAKIEVIDNVEVYIFRGSVTKLWNSMGASNAYYSKVMRNLTDLGCINQLQRGSGMVQTVIALIRAPERGEQAVESDLTSGFDPAMLQQEVESLKRATGGINVVEALRNIESQLEELRREVREIGKDSEQKAGTR